MRIECIFRTQKIPVSYQYLMASVIKGAISSSSEEKFEEIYHYEDKKTKQSKSFCFSVFRSQFEMVEAEFKTKDGFSLISSTPDSELLLHIFNGLLVKKAHQLC